MHKSIWERRSLFTSESRTDSCTCYVTQSCDVTHVMWRDANHTALATFSCCHYDESQTKSSSHPIQSSICDGHICWPTEQNGSWLQRGHFWKSAWDLAVLPCQTHSGCLSTCQACMFPPEQLKWLPAPVPWNDPALTSVSVLMGWSGCCLHMSFNSAIVWSLQ